MTSPVVMRRRCAREAGARHNLYRQATVTLGCVLALAGSALATDAGRVYHVDELVSAATDAYPGLAADGYAIDAAEARLQEAKLSPFFQFTTEAFFTVAPGSEGTPIFSDDSDLPFTNRFYPAGGISVKGALPIYTFGKLRNAKKAARAGIDAANHERARTLARVVHDVRRGYYGVQLALDLQQMISEGKGKLEKALERIEARLEEDDPDVDERDRWRLAAALAEIEGRESQVRRLEQSARAALRLLTGLDQIRVPECPLQLVGSEVLALDDHLRRAREGRPEISMLKAAERAQEANADIKQAGYFPDLLLALSAAYTRNRGITDIQNPFIQDRANQRSFAAGLVARWSLDFAGNVQRVKRAKAEVAALKAKAAEARLGIELEVTDAYESLLDAARREQAWGRGELQTRRWFVASAQGFQVGTTDAKELVEAVKQYFTARLEHLQAISDNNLAISELERSTGTPLLMASGWRPHCGE